MPRKIMIVDDETDFVELIASRLKSLGHELSFAYDGKEALQKIKDERPDLVVLDVLLPDMNGFEVCLKMRQDRLIAGIPVIFLTSLRSSKERAEGMKCGGQAFISKPYDPGVFLEEIQNLLGE